MADAFAAYMASDGETGRNYGIKRNRRASLIEHRLPFMVCLYYWKKQTPYCDSAAEIRGNHGKR